MGRRYLVIHGDIFDLVVQNARWLAHLGDKAYDLAIQMNRFVNMLRRWFGVPYWSLSQWAKLKVKNAVNYIGAFEQTLAAEARRHGADGVICGHIHYATIRNEHWHVLHELRRLGGKLHRTRRARKTVGLRSLLGSIRCAAWPQLLQLTHVPLKEWAPS